MLVGSFCGSNMLQYAQRIADPSCLREIAIVDIPVTPKVGKALLRVASESYKLVAVHATLGDEDRQKQLDCIHQLNAAGRRYMQHDSTSLAEGLNVLSRVIDDLDCLYFHLRENPKLCFGWQTA